MPIQMRTALVIEIENNGSNNNNNNEIKCPPVLYRLNREWHLRNLMDLDCNARV